MLDVMNLFMNENRQLGHRAACPALREIYGLRRIGIDGDCVTLGRCCRTVTQRLLHSAIGQKAAVTQCRNLFRRHELNAWMTLDSRKIELSRKPRLDRGEQGGSRAPLSHG